jgi:hypothetical protein
MASRSVVGFSMMNAHSLVKQLDALATEIRVTVAYDAMQAAMRPVQAAVIALAPESSVTGSRKKQSAKTKQKWSGSKKLKSTIRSVVRGRKFAGIMAGVIGLVGPSYSDGGGHGNLFSRDHKRKVLWGRAGGTMRSVNQFVKRAAGQSRSQAEAAMTAAVKSGIEAAARATTNG